MAPRLRTVLTGFASAAVLSVAGLGAGYAETHTGASTSTSTVASVVVNTPALEAFGLGADSSASWDTMDQRGSVYTFTNFVMAGDDGGFRAATLVLDSPEITDAGPIFASLELSDIEVTGEDNGPVTIDGLSITAPEAIGAEVFAALMQGREPAIDTDELGITAFGSLSVSGLSLGFSDEEGADTGTLELAQMITDIDTDAGVSDFSLSGLSLNAVTEEGMPVSVSLGRMGITGLSLATLEAYSQGSFGEGLGGLTAVPTELDTYDSAEIIDLVVNAGGILVDMPELSGEIDETRNGFISRSNMPSLTISANPSGGPQAAQFAGILAGLGYEQLVFSAVGESVYDEATDRVETRGDNYFRLEDGFEIRSEQAISGISAYMEGLAAAMEGAEKPEELNDATMAALQLMVIERFTFSLEDQSLLDRGLGLAAQMQGGTPESLRMQAAGFAAMIPAFTGGMIPPELATDLQMALSAFINQGGTLNFGIEPDQPTSVGDMVMQGMAGDISGLGLTVSHEAP